METETSGWLGWNASHVLLQNIDARAFNHFGTTWRLWNYCECASLEHIGHGSSKSRILSFVIYKFVLEIISFRKVILPNVVSESLPKRSGGFNSLQKEILVRLSPPRGIGQRLEAHLGRWSKPKFRKVGTQAYLSSKNPVTLFYVRSRR